MQLDDARRIIAQSFEHAFDEAAFRQFVSNLLVGADMKHSGHRSGQMVYESFRDHVAQYKRLAKYVDPNGDVLDVLAVKLRTPHKLGRARTMQRNFVATYLNDDSRPDREAALVAYYADGIDEWRLSLVQLEYRTVVDEDGTVKTEKEITPVRYTFLVGAGEPSHTPQKQFESLVQQETSPTLDRLQEAFDVEVVTDEFFNAYRDHYKALKSEVESALEDDDTARAEFEEKGITPDAFAKKLLGQLVFLYFLQKKGWLGVQKGNTWGEGPKDFLRQLYERKYVDYDNFYQDLLEPLFYDALATDRGSGNFFGRLNCRIPFLNGGLFQPINNFERARVHLSLPNETFGAIFDTFDRYNFTVREDEPLDKEVAVDPEMLGKVFEKMLDADQRKEKGAFYTPRDIVHYMCQQSLIDHLDTAINTRMEPLARSEAQQSDIFRGSPPQQLTMEAESDTPRVKRAHLEALVRDGINWVEHDKRVQNGDSVEGGKYDGTYRAPHPIRKYAREIDAVLADVKVCDPAIGSGAFPVGMMQEIVQARRVLGTYIDDGVDRSAYALKRHAIQETIYGVDIEPSAIDIAQLRLWLSLVVDEEDFRHIKPLPNLRYKIVQGDALQRMERHVFNNEKEDRLHRLMDDYVDTVYPSEKERLQDKIDSLLGELLDEDEFDFRIYFGAVWEIQGGFDIVIGNPPYGNVTDDEAKRQYRNQYQTTEGRIDTYELFVEKSFELCRKNGLLSFIIPSPFLTNYYTRKLRVFVKRRSNILRVDNFGDGVFNDPTVHNCVVFIRRSREISKKVKVSKEVGEGDNLFSYDYEIDHEKLFGGPRYTIDVFIDPQASDIFDHMSEKSVSLGEICEVRQCIKTGDDDKYVKRFDSPPEEPWKPTLKGRSIERYYIRDRSLYVKYGPHLSRNWKNKSFYERPKIVVREASSIPIATIDEDHAYVLSSLYSVYPKPSHDWPNLRYLLAIINSTVAAYYLRAIALSITEGAFTKLKTNQLKRLPIKIIDEDDAEDIAMQDAIVERVDAMFDLHERIAMATTDAECNQLQQKIDATDAEIDRLVYDLYSLSEEEIEIIENDVVG